MKRLAAVILILLGALAAQGQEFRLPFNGRWFVVQGGDTINTNIHMSLQAQWYGLDFARAGGPSRKRINREAPTKNEDFYSWGEPVLSPADGEIVTAVDGLPDNRLGKKDTYHVAGNHVVIKTGENRFVFLAHFQPGTITVKTGRQVKRGMVLGKCGNSGNSDFPHIHMHVQDSALFNTGNGLNPVFSDIRVELNGKVFEGVAWPLIRGLFVENQSLKPDLRDRD